MLTAIRATSHGNVNATAAASSPRRCRGPGSRAIAIPCRHEFAPPFERIATPICALDVAANLMRDCGLGDLAGERRASPAQSRNVLRSPSASSSDAQPALQTFIQRVVAERLATEAAGKHKIAFLDLGHFLHNRERAADEGTRRGAPSLTWRHVHSGAARSNSRHCAPTPHPPSAPRLRIQAPARHAVALAQPRISAGRSL